MPEPHFRIPNKIQAPASFLLLLMLFCGAISGCSALPWSGNDNWNVPEAAKSASNPVPVTQQGLASASLLFADKCAQCHGDNGEGDGPDAGKYKPRPESLTDRRIRQMSDGELFWKITEGRRPMPAFKDQLTDNQRWQVVNFIRSLPNRVSQLDAHAANRSLNDFR